MIEKTIIEYLNKSFSAYLEMPETLPDEFIIVQKTGGSRENQINRATIAIQSYSTSLAKTIELNESVKTAMLNIVTLDNIGSCTLNSDYNFTDGTTKRYRYQAVFDITHY